MGLNRHTSSDGSEGNLGAELSYLVWSRIFSGGTRISDFCPKPKLSEHKSEFLVSPEEMLGHINCRLALSAARRSLPIGALCRSALSAARRSLPLGALCRSALSAARHCAARRSLPLGFHCRSALSAARRSLPLGALCRSALPVLRARCARCLLRSLGAR